MKGRRLSYFAIALLWLLTMFAAFKAGLHLGPEVYADVDSPAKAALLSRELTLVRRGRQDAFLQMKEIELDGQVVRAVRCEAGGGCGYLAWPVGWSLDRPALLREVAAYRSAHPPVVANGEFGRDVAESPRRLQEQYGKP